MGPPAATADGVGFDAGADPDPQRPGTPVEPGPGQCPRDRTRRRRWVWAEDHDVLPRGGPGALRGDATRPAGEVDRGPPGELRGDEPRARADSRCSDRRRSGRPHPRREDGVPVRFRRLYSLRHHRSDRRQHHTTGPVQDSQLSLRVSRGVHQQDHRQPIPRRRPPARCVRDGTPDGPGGPGTRHRPDGGAPPQLHPAPRIPLRRRNSASTGWRCAAATSSSPTNSPTTSD